MQLLWKLALLAKFVSTHLFSIHICKNLDFWEIYFTIITLETIGSFESFSESYAFSNVS